MIINSTGGSVNSVFKKFTLSSDLEYPNFLTITDVDLPGGIVHGLALFAVNTNTLSEVLKDEAIFYVFADKAQAETKQISFAMLSVNDDARYNTYVTPTAWGDGFVYDYANKTLMIKQNHSDSKFVSGSYELLIW